MSALKGFWPSIRSYLLIIAGTLVQAAGLRLFLVPAHLASGGVSGIAQLINYHTAWPPPSCPPIFACF
ncbi:MAG: YitT family protein [Anaerolineales bacterium]|nr:YitT family protein [Anaerolineales bacterium]